jgi:WhiB family transcriptional regulator, redox-sensing transcriptional regulator
MSSIAERPHVVDDWRRQAACRDEDPELFFPVGTVGVEVLLQVREAKAVCGRCPVVGECLAQALEFGDEAGVWGGLDEVERRELARSGSLRGRRVA